MASQTRIGRQGRDGRRCTSATTTASSYLRARSAPSTSSGTSPPFEYHNDPEKTAASRHPAHDNWCTVGDIGYLDDDGYLFLTDRKGFMIISGGVNIYPQEVENALALHPKILDVAVIGVPDAEMGEQVKAVVQLRAGVTPSDELATEIIAYVRDRIARYKAPSRWTSSANYHRSATGKLVKRVLIDRYASTKQKKGTHV